MTQVHRGRAGRASVVDLTFALWLVVIVLFYGRMLVNGDGDLARHLVTGRYIVSHGPRFADPFSFTRAGDPFIAYEWLSQVILAGVHALAGLPGVVVFSALLLATSFALVVLWVRRAGDPWLAFMTGTVAVVLTYPHWLARPHLFTFLGLSLLLFALEARRRVLWLVVLFALWSNLHPGFLYGLGMLALWSAGKAVEDACKGADNSGRIAVRRGGPLLAAAVATLLNPFGAALHAHAIGLASSGASSIFQEFMPLPLASVNAAVFLGVSLLVMAGLSFRHSASTWPAALPFVAAVVLGLLGRRYTTLLPVFALPVATRALAPAVAAFPDWVLGRMRTEFKRSDSRSRVFGTLAAATLGILLLSGGRVMGFEVLPHGFSPDAFPATSVRLAQQRGLRGRLLSEYTWGGYVLFAWPGQQVFIDSMSDFFGPDLIAEYLVLKDVRQGWKELLERRGITLVLFPPQTPLVDALRSTPGWSVVHEDKVSVLLAWSGAGP